MATSRKKQTLATVSALVAALLYYGAEAFFGPEALRGIPAPGALTTTGQSPSGRSNNDAGFRQSSTAQVSEAHRNKRSGVVVELEAEVIKVLPDDNKGSRHQRFLLRISGDHTVLVSHNIDLAPRVKGLSRGDSVSIRGQYEWNDLGGVVHWTHHDPGGRRPGGWIRHRGNEYR